MSIIDQIHLLFNQHIQKYGEQPTVIYLGNWEWRELWLNFHDFISPISEAGKPRDQVHGLSIFRINEDNHLRVA